MIAISVTIRTHQLRRGRTATPGRALPFKKSGTCEIFVVIGARDRALGHGGGIAVPGPAGGTGSTMPGPRA